jgi:hypothetical protein
MATKQNTLERPRCFGLGRDLDSQQRVPVERCQDCSHVTACSLLRLAREAESGRRSRPALAFTGEREGD